MKIEGRRPDHGAEIMGKDPAPNDLDTPDWECPQGGEDDEY